MTSEALTNPYFVRLSCIQIMTKHIFNYKIVKYRSLFLYIILKGGGGACGKQIVKRKCKSENA